MKFITSVCLILTIGSAFGQSKKELQSQVGSLQAEVNSLKAQLEQLKKPKEVDLNNSLQKASYSLGIMMASTLKKQVGDSIIIDDLITGVRDVFSEGAMKVQEQEATAFAKKHTQQVVEKRASKLKESGIKYLNTNKTAPGVITTSSGLQYKILASGNGKSPNAESNVTVHYTGKLIDGTVFDSSVERGTPITFGVKQVIAGWTEALQLMHEGDKWMLYIPSELAYRERVAGQIPPYSVLIFEVELIKVN
jgi:FKBP-type peptidyl-prolyl cis-trans isomerase